MTQVQKYRKLRVLTVAALLTTLSSACSPAYKSDPYYQAEALTKVAVKYAQVGQKDKASEILAQVIEFTKAINHPDGGGSKVHMLTQVAVGYAQAGRYDQAVKVTGLIHSETWRDVALKEVALKTAEAGQYDQALQLTKQMSKPTQNDLVAQTFAKIAIAAAQARHYDKAFQATNAVDAVASYSESYKASTLAKIAEKATHTEPAPHAEQILTQAFQFAQGIKHNKSKASAIAQLAVQYVVVGQKVKASQLLAQALQVAQTIKDSNDKESTLSQIAIQYAVVGQKADAPQMLAQALQIAKSLEKFSSQRSKEEAELDTELAEAEVAVRAAQAGQYEQALTILKPLKGNGGTSYSEDDEPFKDFPGNKTDALTKSALHAARSKNYNQALMFVKSIMPWDSEKAKAWTEVVDEAMQAGQKDEAEQLLNQELRFVNSMNGDNEKASALAEVAIRYVKLGKPNKASRLLDQALWIAENLNRQRVNLGLVRFTI